MLKLSVVINTYNRAESLKNTLLSLNNQSCNDFEVIVVNGPSTDNTIEVISKYKNIKLISCKERNLSKSRNLGIEAASGDIVAFIDDDAIADFNWVKDILSNYDDETIGGVGGLVYDHTGMKLQYHYSACDRFGDTDFNIKKPFDEYNKPEALKFLYLQGTNCSFRKHCLEEIGGFDEEFEYYLDEVDVCMRIIDKGYKIKPLDCAIVHHKYMKSFLRNEERVILHPYSTVKNKFYFAYKNNRDKNDDEINKRISKWYEEVINGGKYNYSNNKMTFLEYKTYEQETIEAKEVGIKQGKKEPKTRILNCADAKEFLQFNTMPINYPRLKICYVSKEYPPENFGGIGRYTYDLATTFAKMGHDVHVVTEGKEQDTVDFEDGVWVHRLVSKMFLPFSNCVLGWNFSLLYRNYQELKRIHNESKIDIINGPIWLCETGLCNILMKDIPVIVTLMTTQKIISKIMNSTDDFSQRLIQLENSVLHQHKYIHPISESINNSCKESYAKEAKIYISPLGCRDLKAEYTSKSKEQDKINILCVGRLEERKGTDLLLSSAVKLLHKYQNLQFTFAGKDTQNTKSGISFREEFYNKYCNDASVIDNVKFLGSINEKTLMEAYANSDICCTPSRYESFGIVVLEAMSFGKAIVAANIGGIKSIIKDQETGLLFESENIDALTEKLECLIEDERLRKKLAVNARKDFEENYSLEVVYKNLYNIYLEIIKSHKQNIDKKDNIEEFINLIMESENLSEKDSKNIVEQILYNPGISYSEIPAQQSLVHKLYMKVNKLSPKFAEFIKRLIYDDYMQVKSIKNRSKTYKIIKLIYLLLTRIPLMGRVIKYFTLLMMAPIILDHINKKADHIINSVEFQQYEFKLLKEAVDSKSEIIAERVEDSSRFLKEAIDSKSEIIHYDLENQRNLLRDEINQRITTSRSEILFEINRNNTNISSKEIETKIINKNKIEKLKNNKVCLNLGAGHITFADYVNIDSREIENIDIVADIKKLPFEIETVDKIYASHVIEHIKEREFKLNVLPHWISLLKVGGTIELILPDLESMIKNYSAGNYEFSSLKEVIFGLQRI